MQQYSRRNILGLMGGVMAGGAIAGLVTPALAAPALQTTAAAPVAPAPEPEKGFAWTPRKLPDLAKVQAVARERFYHNGWG
jgi:hypothetical protein